MSLLYKGDIGARLIISTDNTNIAESATLHLFLQKPSGTTVEIDITAPMVNYTTGVITYYTVSGDLNESGEYKAQLKGNFVDGSDLVSDQDSFTVYERLALTA